MGNSSKGTKNESKTGFVIYYIQNRAAFIQQLDISENMAAIIVGMLNGIVIQANVDPKRIKIKAIFDELILFMRSFVEKT